jgi:hypothetical protein
MVFAIIYISGSQPFLVGGTLSIKNNLAAHQSVIYGTFKIWQHT